MKKIFLFLILSVQFLFADNYTDMIDLIDLNKHIEKSMSYYKEAQRYVDLKIFEYETSYSFMKTRLSQSHTFMWYIWNDYDNSTGFTKLDNAKLIFKLSK